MTTSHATVATKPSTEARRGPAFIYSVTVVEQIFTRRHDWNQENGSIVAVKRCLRAGDVRGWQESHVQHCCSAQDHGGDLDKYKLRKSQFATLLFWLDGFEAFEKLPPAAIALFASRKLVANSACPIQLSRSFDASHLLTFLPVNGCQGSKWETPRCCSFKLSQRFVPFWRSFLRGRIACHPLPAEPEHYVQCLCLALVSPICLF